MGKAGRRHRADSAPGGAVDPLGRHFNFGNAYKSDRAVEIVGVVEDAKYTDMRGDVPLTAYMPFPQSNLTGAVHFEVRTAGDPTLLISSLRAAVQKVDSNLAISDVKTQNQQIDEALVQEKLFARLSSFFGALALVLTAIGLYGTMAYSVTRKTNEIGIRVALGAMGSQILQNMLSEAFTWS
jgi:ABC-type antimicrobial peptide transport system permease subunit